MTPPGFMRHLRPVPSEHSVSPNLEFGVMHTLSIIGSLLILVVSVASAETKRVELAPKTYLVIDQSVRSGLFEASVFTSLAIEWPNSRFADKIGKVSFYNGNEDLRLLTVASKHILVYGSSLYHRPVAGGSWSWWPARNSVFSPPVPSITSYLRDWFRAHGRTDCDYVPYVEGGADELITFRPSPEQPQISFGSRTHWTLPYRLSSADVPSNTIRYETAALGLPRFLVFTGPPNFFGDWEFSPAVTSAANK